MGDFINAIFSSDGFIPHGHCYLWRPGVLWLHILSDGLIALAYYSIPITLLYFVRKRKDLEFHWMFVCFAVFILACGTTHLMEIWNVWHPTYWLSGGIKAITALVSIPTAILLAKLIPMALTLPSPSALQTVNKKMECEIAERKHIERNLYEKNIELENANLAKDRFLANMSHELRTPLNAIIGFSEVLKDGMFGALSSKQSGFTHQIFNSGKHLLALINDILDLSKVEAGKMTLDLEEVAIDELLQASLDIVKGRAAKRGIILKFDSYPGSDRMVVDARKLRQIAYNLLSNAEKFTSDGGAVTLSWRPLKRSQLTLETEGMATRVLPLPASEFEDFIEILVSDNGIGVNQQELSDLFQPFLQLDSSMARQYQGTGLGLALVSRLAELHGGTVGVASTPGRGTRFVVWLPWRKAGAQVIADNPIPGSALPASERSSSNRHASSRQALIIEDDRGAAELLRIHLESAGFQVHWVQDATAALDLATRESLDLITLDLLLPNTDGWEILNQLKMHPLLETVPVVVVSIVAEEERGFVFGAAKVLQKPVARKTLLNTIYALGLGNQEKRESTVLVVDDDPAAVELICAHLEGQNCRVLRAYDGDTAIKTVRHIRPDLIILDLMLPDISGLEVVEIFKHQPDTSFVPIIVVTSKTVSQPDRARLQQHVLQIMEKGSFSHQQFLAEVSRALRRN